MKQWLHTKLPDIIASLDDAHILPSPAGERRVSRKAASGGPVPVQFYHAPSPHRHEHPEIAVVLEGPVFFEIDKRAMEASEGSVLLFGPQTLHYDSYLSSGTPYSLLWYILWPASPRINVSRYRPGRGFQLAEVLDLKAELIPQDDWSYVASLGGARRVRSGRVRELMYSLLAATFDAARRSGPRREVSATRAVVRDAVTFLKDRLSEAPTVEMAASFVGLSPTYLTTLVRQELGKPLHDVLAETRLERAATLLKETRLSIKEVARLSGFSAPDYFTRTFSRATGVSPSQYRLQGTR